MNLNQLIVFATVDIQFKRILHNLEIGLKPMYKNDTNFIDLLLDNMIINMIIFCRQLYQSKMRIFMATFHYFILMQTFSLENIHSEAKFYTINKSIKNNKGFRRNLLLILEEK